MTAHRRDFLAGFGGFALGIAATSASAKTDDSAPEPPWPYEKLDVELIRKLGHKHDYSTNCASGAFIAIVEQLRERVGHPWTLVPLNLYAYSGGGVNGWGTLCGALNGSAGAISLAAGPAQGKLVNELFGWYSSHELPGEESNRYARERAYLVEKYAFEGELPSAVPGSPLCHVSIARWCAASGLGAGTPQRAERCARLCGDVAAKAVELLNSWKDGSFAPSYAPRTEVTGCESCHAAGKDEKKKQVSVGKMDCLDCHQKHALGSSR